MKGNCTIAMVERKLGTEVSVNCCLVALITIESVSIAALIATGSQSQHILLGISCVRPTSS